MEYSIWSFFGAIWSALGFITEVKIYCHMEYSIWLFYDAIWSTPYGRNLRPHGVLHNVVKNVYCWRNTKNSTRLIFAAPWSTPCGHYFMPHGVLHMVVFWCHMECFRIHHRGQILLPYGVLHMANLLCHKYLTSNVVFTILLFIYYFTDNIIIIIITQYDNQEWLGSLRLGPSAVSYLRLSSTTTLTPNFD